MDRMDFTQSVVRIKVMEKRLLDNITIDKLVDANDIEEVIKILETTEYASSISKVKDSKNYEEILYNELNRVYELVREITPYKAISDLMALKYDYHNIKVMLKERLKGEDLSSLYIPIGTTDFNIFKNSFETSDFRDIDVRFSSVIQEVLSDFEKNSDPQRIDILVDKAYFNHMYDIAKDTGIELFINYVKDLIDFTNIIAVLRLKKQNKGLPFVEEVLLPNGNIELDQILVSYADSIDAIINRFRTSNITKALKAGLDLYNSTGRISAFEKSMDDHLMELIKESKSVVFGPEPIFAYLVAKEMEIKVLRIIMVSKLNNISPQAIRERLRELYV
ncbi:V-type ATP synthase subunit C [Soehngenia longivitae]|uniref:V-type ATP synthase subunit C n=1 Tax=Soehngenia longivitae TaxID=2562294 RepID=A0A4Z0D934_9FIRM|nr:V-type ATP synthase subunit C [Soehngenia longivitae]TFZ41397.1 V-type ATP synthase subunit C [Soehngenia longivitae]